MRRLSWTSLRLRLALAGGAAVFLLLGAAALGLALLFERHVERRSVEEVSVHLNQLAAGLERDAAGRLTEVQPPLDARYRKPFSGRYWQIETEDGPIVSRSLWDSLLELPPPTRPPGMRREYIVPGPDGETLLVVDRWLVLGPGKGGQEVRVAVALDRAELRRAARAFLADLVPAFGVLALLLIAAGWTQLAFGLKPLRRVGSRVAAVRSGARSRLGSDFPDEIRPLAAEVDALLETREGDVARARARASDLAHGLKTPLQALYGEALRLAERGEASAAESIEETVAVIQGHVDRELHRARIASTGWAAASRPAEVIEQVVRVVRRTPDGARIGWQVEGAGDIRVRMEAGDLTEALGAIIENAARHASARVRIDVRRDAAHAIIRIADDGGGVPGNDLDRMVGRGTRLDQAGPGTGLGLAIVSDICEAAGADLHITNGSWPDGASGLEVNLRIGLAPISAPDEASR